MQLDDLQYPSKNVKKTFRAFLKEIRIFIIFFVVVAIVMLVVTNLNLFVSSFSNLFDTTPAQVKDISSTSEDNDIATIIDKSDATSDQVDALLQKYQSGWKENNNVSPSPQGFLRSKLKDYPFAFNTLPPVDEIIIPSLGLEVPIIVAKGQSVADFSQGNFDDELMSGVVKYPTTPDPGSEGNTLIFGHTSQEFWKHNAYGTIFKGLPKLANGDTIKIIWKWSLYEYKVIDKFVVPPKQVNAQYMSYQNAGNSYITLMGCYPLGTDKNRIMVVAKLVK